MKISKYYLKETRIFGFKHLKRQTGLLLGIENGGVRLKQKKRITSSVSFKHTVFPSKLDISINSNLTVLSLISSALYVRTSFNSKFHKLLPCLVILQYIINSTYE